eukprot:SM000019S05101  [mRNA]  locus=s19:929060:931200:- [translate_table: standard]
MADDEPRVDWLNLPCPVKYEEMQREALMSLKPEHFEGLRFDFTKPLNQKFSLSHGLFMGSVEVPSQTSQIIKIPSAHYEFGPNLIDSRMMLIGRILTDGRMSARVKYDVTDHLSLKINAQLVSEPHFSQAMFQFDYKGWDYQAQLQLGNNAFYGFNYIQSVTPTLALGGEAFWLGHQRKSGVGFAARHASDKSIATGQVASTGLVALTYVQKVSEKVALASDFTYNWNTKEATTSVGYDYILRQVRDIAQVLQSWHLSGTKAPPAAAEPAAWFCGQCRLRGRVDTAGVVAAFLEERLNVGVTFLLSAEVDHVKKDYKFGFGMTVGE